MKNWTQSSEASGGRSPARRGGLSSPGPARQSPVRIVAFATLGLLLLGFLGGAAAHTPASASSDFLAVTQTGYVTEHSSFTVSIQVPNPSNVQYAYFTFCQLSSPVCYLPVFMTLHGTNWFVGTTHPMTNYSGMLEGVRAGYNITIVYNDNTNATAPFLPNPFNNLTVVTSVTGEYMFQMTVSPQQYSIRGLVTDSVTGLGVAGAAVTLTPGPSTTTTGSTGAYSFQGLLNGSYTVSVSAAGYQAGTLSVAVAGSNTTQNVAVTNASEVLGHPNSGAMPWYSGLSSPYSLGLIAAGAIVLGVLGVWALRRRKKPAPAPRSTPPEPTESSSETAP